MEIINYNNKYDENIKDLLVEEQEYIQSIDREKYNIITEEFREKYFEKIMKNIYNNEGKILLAKEDNKIVGVIISIINNEKENTYDFAVPKRGRILDISVSKEYQSKGIGKNLLNEMENYLKTIGCKGILMDVFSYNEKAKNFYYTNGYFDRTIEIMKHI